MRIFSDAAKLLLGALKVSWQGRSAEDLVRGITVKMPSEIRCNWQKMDEREVILSLI